MGLPLESNPEPLEFICKVRCLGGANDPLDDAIGAPDVGDDNLDEDPDDEAEDEAMAVRPWLAAVRLLPPPETLVHSVASEAPTWEMC